MNTKNLVVSSMLLGVGTVLYLVIPGINGGMKPDFLLTMMFITILLTPTVKHTVVVGLATGLLSGLFTTFPGGFLPNVIDKFITALAFFALVVILKTVATKLVTQAVLTAAGTALSGAIFLASAIFIMGAEVPFTVLYLGVVLPAIALNTIAFVIIYPIVQQTLKRSSLRTSVAN
ncbi:tryptophan transporter [Chryseomicrobium sp. FSL W7-1435]|uniref:tryptophan transporter n=1 Tax=Chryseomicrobium sp. FSL W7-1435 TaxID=2921704 RepID=UPI00315A4452